MTYNEYIEQNLNHLANDHIETWKDRYWRKSLAEIENDLQINFDFSADIDDVEETIERELTDDEKEDFEQRFIKAVLDNFYN